MHLSHCMRRYWKLSTERSLPRQVLLKRKRSLQLQTASTETSWLCFSFWWDKLLPLGTPGKAFSLNLSAASWELKRIQSLISLFWELTAFFAMREMGVTRVNKYKGNAVKQIRETVSPLLKEIRSLWTGTQLDLKETIIHLAMPQLSFIPIICWATISGVWSEVSTWI